ncbi:hypothetical protein TNIN_413361 [Trichonephila inaurata madagascariensis]|uniref:Uncharacterized protein n=1 Tax=Trichonephila inaurata madagascariensis TaxID=2747483 RepID=A0A8X6Y134_9ARAC|nr:hypothetical protein TNIN_413361 [Trichonephila inaurata madagascariensis]
MATMSMQIAAKEAKEVNGYSDIPVAINGTWQKHGHTSLNGAVIATSETKYKGAYPFLDVSSRKSMPSFQIVSKLMSNFRIRLESHMIENSLLALLSWIKLISTMFRRDPFPLKDEEYVLDPWD